MIRQISQNPLYRHVTGHVVLPAQSIRLKYHTQKGFALIFKPQQKPAMSGDMTIITCYIPYNYVSQSG
jgi:hypothetical protein